MTPAARIAAAIEVLETIDANARPGDELVTAYFRSRRYIGSKDRRAISERAFAIERKRAHLDWWTQSNEPRARVIADLALNDGLAVDAIDELFDGGRFGPAPLSPDERIMAERLAGLPIDAPDMPPAVQFEMPEWILDILQTMWGEHAAREITALNRPAPLDLRVNTLKGNRADAIARLAEDEIIAVATTMSPIGLRVNERANLTITRAYKDGLVEVQDEASQIAALLTGAKADRMTIDLCAGGGGKTLALAAMMKDGGPLIACDTDKRRLHAIEARLKRAGISNVTRKHLTGLDDPALAALEDRAVRVLIDAPCSGSGAWRRNPGARWRLTPERLDQLIAEQRRILTAAANLVAPGGRLIYVTCSIFDGENQAQADLFLDANPLFRAIPIAEVWKTTVRGTAPTDETYLTLTPARNATDGFFVAVFEKVED